MTRAMIKSKYPPMRPTQAIGSPLPQPSVDVPEPATLTGDWSGKPYVRVGDSPYGRESFQVTPPGGRPPASMANGGSAVVGPTDTPPPPFDPFTDPRWTGNAPMGEPRPGDPSFNQWTDPRWTGREPMFNPGDPEFSPFTDPRWTGQTPMNGGADSEEMRRSLPEENMRRLPDEQNMRHLPDDSAGAEPFWEMVRRLHSGGTRAQVPGKPVSMGFGGGGSVGPDTGDYDPNTMLSNNPNVQYSTPDPQQPPPQQPQQQPQAPAPAPYDPVRTQYNNQNTVYQNQNAGVDARVAQTNAQGQVYSATAGTFGPMQNQINANGQVIDAQSRVTGASRALIQNSQADNSARTAEEQQLQADARNTPDLQAAAQAQTYRNDMAYKNSAAGVSAAQEYVAPPGDNSQAPAGTLAKIQTKGQVDATAFANADKLRALQLEAQKSGVDLLSNDVQGLQEVAAKVGLSVDQARLLVSEASNKADFAGLAVQNADLNTSRAVIRLNESKNIDPSKVIYTDSSGQSRLVSPGEKRTLEADDQRNFELTRPGDVLYTDPYTKQRDYESQAEADQKKIDYQRQLDTDNLAANANLGGARTVASNAVQSSLDVGYANDPVSAPVQYLLAHMQNESKSGAAGPAYATPAGPGVFTRQQVIAALLAKRYTYQQAIDLTTPNATGGGGTQITIPNGAGFGH